MQLKGKVLTPLQLQFLTIVFEICGITAASFGLWNESYFNFFPCNFLLTCTVFGISGILFIAIIVSQRFSESETLRKLEWLFHVVAGSMMMISSIAWFLDPCASIFCVTFPPRIAAILIGLLVNGPLHLVIGAQLYTAKLGRDEPLYWMCSFIRTNPLQGQQVLTHETNAGAGLLDSCYTVDDPRYRLPRPSSVENTSSSPTFMAQQGQKFTEYSPLSGMHSV